MNPDRRRLLGVLALSGCNLSLRARPTFPPIRASADRITRITVCTRPFRPKGPRIEPERIGDKTVIHNYGHGGSGWSLSWGSGAIATQLAMATGERDVGIIGAGALGLTTATLLQRAGARVTIYAKDVPPNVRSSLATGLWTPDSRICFADNATPAFKQAWQSMTRASYDAYQAYLGLPGTPVEYIDQYLVSDTADTRRHHDSVDGRPAFASLQHELANDLLPNSVELAQGAHPFKHRHARRNTTLMFNINAYAHLLMNDFLVAGGTIVVRELRSPAELAALPQRTFVNATGYGARALFGDDTIVPVRGQLARLVPQREIDYGVYYRGVSFVPRRDGLVVQAVGPNDYYGFGDDSTTPDRKEAESAVETIAALFDRV